MPNPEENLVEHSKIIIKILEFTVAITIQIEFLQAVNSNHERKFSRTDLKYLAATQIIFLNSTSRSQLTTF